MVVCGQVGVVEGNRFAENAREWSPRGAKIKTVLGRAMIEKHPPQI